MELIFQTPACPFEEISHSLSKSWSNERSDRVIKDKQGAPPSCLALGPTPEPGEISLTPRHLPTCSRSEKNTNTNTNTKATSLTSMQVRALPAVPVVGRQILCSNEEGKLLALVNGNPERISPNDWKNTKTKKKYNQEREGLLETAELRRRGLVYLAKSARNLAYSTSSQSQYKYKYKYKYIRTNMCTCQTWELACVVNQLLVSGRLLLSTKSTKLLQFQSTLPRIRGFMRAKKEKSRS